MKQRLRTVLAFLLLLTLARDARASPAPLRQAHKLDLPPLQIDESWIVCSGSASIEAYARLVVEGKVLFEEDRDAFPAGVLLREIGMPPCTAPTTNVLYLLQATLPPGPQHRTLADDFGFDLRWLDRLTLTRAGQGYILSARQTAGRSEILVLGGGLAGVRSGVVDLLRDSSYSRDPADCGSPVRECRLWRRPLAVLDYPDVRRRFGEWSVGWQTTAAWLLDTALTVGPSGRTVEEILGNCAGSFEDTAACDNVSANFDALVWGKYTHYLLYFPAAAFAAVDELSTSSSARNSLLASGGPGDGVTGNLQQLSDYLLARGIEVVPTLRASTPGDRSPVGVHYEWGAYYDSDGDGDDDRQPAAHPLAGSSYGAKHPEARLDLSHAEGLGIRKLPLRRCTAPNCTGGELLPRTTDVFSPAHARYSWHAGRRHAGRNTLEPVNMLGALGCNPQDEHSSELCIGRRGRLQRVRRLDDSARSATTGVLKAPVDLDFDGELAAYGLDPDSGTHQILCGTESERSFGVSLNDLETDLGAAAAPGSARLAHNRLYAFSFFYYAPASSAAGGASPVLVHVESDGWQDYDVGRGSAVELGATVDDGWNDYVEDGEWELATVVFRLPTEAALSAMRSWYQAIDPAPPAYVLADVSPTILLGLGPDVCLWRPALYELDGLFRNAEPDSLRLYPPAAVSGYEDTQGTYPSSHYSLELLADPVGDLDPTDMTPFYAWCEKKGTWPDCESGGERLYVTYPEVDCGDGRDNDKDGMVDVTDAPDAPDAPRWADNDCTGGAIVGTPNLYPNLPWLTVDGESGAGTPGDPLSVAVTGYRYLPLWHPGWHPPMPPAKVTTFLADYVSRSGPGAIGYSDDKTNAEPARLDIYDELYWTPTGGASGYATFVDQLAELDALYAAGDHPGLSTDYLRLYDLSERGGWNLGGGDWRNDTFYSNAAHANNLVCRLAEERSNGFGAGSAYVPGSSPAWGAPGYTDCHAVAASRHRFIVWDDMFLGFKNGGEHDPVRFAGFSGAMHPTGSADRISFPRSTVFATWDYSHFMEDKVLRLEDLALGRGYDILPTVHPFGGPDPGSWRTEGIAQWAWLAAGNAGVVEGMSSAWFHNAVGRDLHHLLVKAKVGDCMWHSRWALIGFFHMDGLDSGTTGGVVDSSLGRHYYRDTLSATWKHPVTGAARGAIRLSGLAPAEKVWRSSPVSLRRQWFPPAGGPELRVRFPGIGSGPKPSVSLTFRDASQSTVATESCAPAAGDWSSCDSGSVGRCGDDAAELSCTVTLSASAAASAADAVVEITLADSEHPLWIDAVSVLQSLPRLDPAFPREPDLEDPSWCD